MAKAHVVLNKDEEVMQTLCGERLSKEDVTEYGIYGSICAKCAEVARKSWVTVE